MHIDGMDGAELTAGQSAQLGGYEVTFQRFEVPELDKHRAADEAITAHAVLQVKRDGRTTTLKPAYVVSPTDVQRVPVMMPGDDYQISVFRILPEQGSVQLMVAPMTPMDAAAIEVSYKPHINVLWLGGFLMALGPFMAWRRRSLLARRSAEETEGEREIAPAPQRRRGRASEPRPAPVTASAKK
jgi:cytochrome c biogenesis factor